MASNNIYYANTNLRWCLRAWKDGEMRDLALFLFRKAISQLLMADLNPETMAEIVASHLGKEAYEDLMAFNAEIDASPEMADAWRGRVACLVLC